ncbi:MAG: tripartite tricarboxylate transporter substrate binding protein [Hyphomicrobiales bacterium]|nr:tripartite tricarboxylate transporter substrate binding protein [Rhabdaerophilum calidifontis]MCA1951710.1 tripartite tricarboxylate transporter substrate binding protein [Hyphomicrobiales bacterium]MCA1998546.1 tripartite tricarboxylate transporter substrate binding protein [Hyphomicrobiales bacterium]
MRVGTRLWLGLLGLAALALAAPGARAQADYPAKTVTIVVPFAAGGTTDMLGRILADRLGQRLKGTFIVENKAGAGGNIGVSSVAKATPDGYTLGMGTVSTHSINPNVYKTIPYDHVKDFIPLSLVASVPNILLVNPEISAKTVPELVALLKKEPGKHAFASSGAGTSIHLAGELFKLASGTDLVHVPYRSSGQITQDLLSGKILMTFDNITIAWPHVQAGKLRALATATPERLPFAKDLPAMSEFYPGFAATSWHGIFAPAGTPKAITDKLSTEVQAILREPETVAKLKAVGVTPIGSNSAEFAAFIASETARWKEVAAKANIKIE